MSDKEAERSQGNEQEPEEGLSPPPPGPLRKGYTTGACAAAAAKAATLYLLEGLCPSKVEIRLPLGPTATFAIHRCWSAEEGSGRGASVIKDAGDDPDVTHGAEICVEVRPAGCQGIQFIAGPGVGTVTKPGLELAVGEPAVNPVPRKMIREAVEAAVLQAKKEPVIQGFQVRISVPGGEALALKTLNGRLGIVGGLSILGTTGIVTPYSASSYKASIVKAMDVALATGNRRIVISTGRRSERFAQVYFDWPEECFVEMGDFLEFALRHAARRPLEQVVVSAFVGKLAKVAAGAGQTHSSRSRVDLDFLARLAETAGAPSGLAEKIRSANTARQALSTIHEAGVANFASLLAARAWEECNRMVKGRIPLTVLFFDFDGRLLARSD